VFAVCLTSTADAIKLATTHFGWTASHNKKLFWGVSSLSSFSFFFVPFVSLSSLFSYLSSALPTSPQ